MTDIKDETIVTKVHVHVTIPNILNNNRPKFCFTWSILYSSIYRFVIKTIVAKVA